MGRLEAIWRRAAGPALYLSLILAAAIDAWAGRRSYLAADTTSYMNMVSQITQGHLGEAINGHWSPLYPLLLSAFVWPIEPNLTLEFAVVRIVNFLIFIATLFIFRDFLRRFLDRYDAMPAVAGARFNSLGRSQAAALAWTAFVLACFSLNMVCRVSPDCLVVAITLAIASTLLSFRGDTSIWRFIAFGVLIGVGYWAKSILFVMAFVFLAAALTERSVRALKGRLALSAAVFLLIAAPLIAAQSARYGHLSFSESGRLSYAWFVNGVHKSIHWMGDGPASQGTPTRHSALIHRNPDVYAWDAPVPVSYHPWYDPSYWFQGVEAHFDASQQFATIIRSVRDVIGVARQRWPLIIPLLLAGLFWLSDRPWSRLRNHLGAFLPIWLVAAANLGVYFMVLVVDRYLAAAISLLWLLGATLAGVPRAKPEMRRIIDIAVPVLCVVCTFAVCGPRLLSAATVIVQTHGDVRDDRWVVGQEFRRIGVPIGAPVGSIGEAFINDWHRLAQVRVIAEIPSGDGFTDYGQVRQFWRLDPAGKNEVMAAFRAVGAQWVVANNVPAEADTSGWTRIGESEFYYRRSDAPFQAPATSSTNSETRNPN